MVQINIQLHNYKVLGAVLKTYYRFVRSQTQDKDKHIVNMELNEGVAKSLQEYIDNELISK